MSADRSVQFADLWNQFSSLFGLSSKARQFVSCWDGDGEARHGAVSLLVATCICPAVLAGAMKLRAGGASLEGSFGR